eukprot:550326-Amphidinium_carterae.1
MKNSAWTTGMIALQWNDLGSEKPVRHGQHERSCATPSDAHHERNRWWTSEFDPTLGYPGEGPRMLVAPHQSKADLRVRVQPVTEERYRARVRELECWLAEQKLPCVKDLVEGQQWQGANAALIAYVQALHNSGQPVSYGTWTLAGVQYQYPALSGHIAGAWLTQRQWQRLMPSQMRPPLPTRVLLAMCVVAWCLDWRRSCLALMIGFQALLRPLELSLLRRQHIILPRDLAGHDHSLVVCITQSKTMHRTARLQSVLVTDPVIVELADILLAHDAASAPLVRGGLKELHQKYEFIRRKLDLQGGPFTLGTLRGGGAVFHIQACQSIALLQWKGRWTTERSVQHYLQVGLAASALAAVPASTRERISALADLAPLLLRPECNGLRSSVCESQNGVSAFGRAPQSSDMMPLALRAADGKEWSAREHLYDYG